MGLGYPNNNKESILYQLKCDMFTILDKVDNKKIEIILNPQQHYFVNPNIKTEFYPEGSKRYHFLNTITTNVTQINNIPIKQTFPNVYIPKIEFSLSEPEIIVSQELKVKILKIFRMLDLLTDERDDNRFTHFNKPLIINNIKESLPIIHFQFISPHNNNNNIQEITLRPRNYVKRIQNNGKILTHFINGKDIIFGLPFFKYRAVTFNDRYNKIYIKEIDLDIAENNSLSNNSLSNNSLSNNSLSNKNEKFNNKILKRKRIIKRPIKKQSLYNNRTRIESKSRKIK